MFFLARLYSFVYVFFVQYFRINIRGLGFLLRRVRTNREVVVCGHRIWFDHRQAEAYSRLISGYWNEPETHAFLSYLFSKLAKPTFIEVGANIGEILVDVASQPNVDNCIVFEPNPQCVEVIKRSMSLNKLNHYRVIPKAVGSKTGIVKMHFGSHSPSVSLLSSESQIVGVDVDLTTLDLEIKSSDDSNIVLLIDVEGYEAEVLRGAANLIEHNLPLIIFEYNSMSKQYFSVAEIRQILGGGYRIYRLRKDAYLDGDVENAWNCVAIPDDSIFQSIVRARIIQK